MAALKPYLISKRDVGSQSRCAGNDLEASKKEHKKHKHRKMVSKAMVYLHVDQSVCWHSKRCKGAA